ncbi:tetratricopeptide repeat protein [Oscillochloris sp. ZM17-4]|uniref:adenylate/guanylate cyclase domain-containing protein n=1 Tax=Oscillochloris sp. ZM17-4 TaxID=2866714 RepID=UPI001C734944|nr:adenylate/guanylate cyclase domain-containing protein [Oscillochloris sp. ZM17-4]MBX0326942.1 tetratricopeptide repeat protein [Oscillochloris sp. ZM17-4]
MRQLLAHLPYQIAADLARGADDIVGRTHRDQAVTLFADVSGFTPMSEALSRFGQDGTEDLTTLLNDYFAVMIDLIASYGGVVASFGGDSLTALFMIGDGAGAAEASARAVRCALDMQLLMVPYQGIETRAGTFSLAIKIGMAVGPVLVTVVGDPEVRLQSVIAGQPLERAAEAEHLSHSGDVMIHRDLLALVPAAVAAEDRGDYRLIVDLGGSPSYAPLPPLPPVDESLLPTLSAFLHPSLARRLLDGQAGFVNEHRSVTVLFVGFSGFDYDDDPLVGARLQAYIAQVARIVERYDGDLNKVDMGDKGSKLVVIFGAPISHENDAERAMRCALALRELRIEHVALNMPDVESQQIPPNSTFNIQHPTFSIRIGIASGLVYCGLVGAEIRREYTVMGDTVNLAARLMQAAAPGEVIAASGAHRPVADQFLWTPLDALQVRGRSRSVPVYRLEQDQQRASRHQEPSYKLPMVGREEEMLALEERLELARGGRGQVVGICAEAGMGKSRLVAEAIRMAARRGMTVHTGECLSHGGSISYLPWNSLLLGIFGVDPGWSKDVQLRHLRERVSALAPQVLRRLPVLAGAMNLPVDETDQTRALDARVRKDVLETTALECLRAVAVSLGPGAGLLLVIEDCHWIDSLSHDLLDVVARGIAGLPVMILLAYRPPEHEHARLRVSRLPHFRELLLREFSLRETEWLIGLKFGYLFGARGVLPASFVERITTRSQGNPFYIDQMINYIQDQGISPSDTNALAMVRLPDSLRSLIISRIDRLSEQEQITLKVASVVGRVFRASWLWGIYPQIGRPEQVRANLDRLSNLDLTPMEKAEPELEYLFKHMMTQEVAYESLAYATRAMLHEQVGDYIESRFAAEVERYLDMLAYHYGRSENLGRQRHYFLRAGQAAQAAYANDIALSYYRRLLPLLAPPEQAPVLLRVGEVLQLVGRWAEAEAAVGQAQAIAEEVGDVAGVARCQNATAELLAARGEYDAAMAILDVAIPAWERLGDLAGHYEALRIFGSILIDTGAYTRGLRSIEHAHELAVRLDDQALIARSIGAMGVAYMDISDYEMALYCLERSAEMAARLGDWGLLARSRESIGSISLNQSQLVDALEIFHELLLRAVEIGDRWAAARLTHEIGRAHTLYGDAGTGMGCYARQLAAALELGERRDLAIGLGYLAYAYARLGKHRMAERAVEMAISLCDAIRLVYWACEFRHDCAQLLTVQGRYAEASALNDAALQTARRLGSNKAMQLQAVLLAARLRVLLGQEPAESAIPPLAELDEDWFGAGERAAIHYAIWQIDPGREADRLAAATTYAALATAMPTALFRARAARLTGGIPAAPAPLPALPAVISTAAAPPLPELIAQIEQMIIAA